MILGITPARGGSKGVPRKNVRPLAGKPLIAWTIESALSSSLLDRFVVSTEDHSIASLSQGLGAEVIDRPAELATDGATTLAVLQHALTLIAADIIVLLQCTSPVRSGDLIDQCISRFLLENSDSAATGYRCSLYEWGSYDNMRRQDLDGWFHDDGSVYVMKAENILKGDQWGKNRTHVFTPRDHHFEIDDEFDFWINEKILETLIS